MKRSMMQAYLAKSDEAVAHYQAAFDATLINSYANEDGTFMLVPLAPCGFSSLMTDLIDKFGI
jgi:uncharacterized glyoxalase superfamily protein PhnB